MSRHAVLVLDKDGKPVYYSPDAEVILDHVEVDGDMVTTQYRVIPTGGDNSLLIPLRDGESQS